MDSWVWNYSNWPNLILSSNLFFTTREEMPFDNPAAISNFIAKHQPQYFVNCAAHTAVDKAESEKELAYQINAEAPGIIAKACKENNVQLIHISTDYVFNGTGTVPYKERMPQTP